MSALTKVFVILIFLISVSTAAILAGLYGQRVDWHDKFIKEVNQHYYSIQVLRAEAEAREIEIRNKEKVIEAKDAKIAGLQNELNSKEGNVVLLKNQLTDLSGKFQQTLEHTEALNRNLAVLIGLQQELQNANAGLRDQRNQAVNERQQAQTELFDLKGNLAQAKGDLEKAEEAFIEASRDLGTLQKVVDGMRERGIDVDVIPSPRLDAKVRGTAPELGLVVVSVGADEGVTRGMKFTVFRGPEFVCTVTIENVERTWASGRILVKQMDPRVGDDATNDIHPTGAAGGSQ